MRVFIDANIYLKLFTLKIDQQEYLDRLIELVKAKKITIVFPKITQSEILRNISGVTSKSRKIIDETKVKKPDFKEIHDEKTRLKIEKAFSSWTSAVDELNQNYVSNIKKLTKKIFDDYRNYTVDFEELSKLVEQASHRKLKGYPPGKGLHMGDELCWEILKHYCTDDDLVIISSDPDWIVVSEEGPKKLHRMLYEEWKFVSSKDVKLYESLGEFLSSVGKRISKKDIEQEKKVTQPFFMTANSLSATQATGNFYYSNADVATFTAPFGTYPRSIKATKVSNAFQGENIGTLHYRDNSVGQTTCYNCGIYVGLIQPDMACPYCGVRLP